MRKLPDNTLERPGRTANQALCAGLAYFALVLGTGFLLGVVRVSSIVPRIGERWAELAEMPLMAAVIFFAAGYVLRRFPAARSEGRSSFVGIFALALLICAELGLAVALQNRTLGEYLRSRDPVSGSVYLAMLVVFALMPRFRLPRHDPASGEAQPLPSSGRAKACFAASRRTRR